MTGAQEPCQPRANGGGGEWLARVAPRGSPKGPAQGPLGPRWSAGRHCPVDTGAAWGWPGRLRRSLCSPRPPPGPERLGAFCGRAAGGPAFMWGCGKVPGPASHSLSKAGIILGPAGHPLKDIPPSRGGGRAPPRGPVHQALALQAPWPGRVPWVETLPPAVQLPGSEPRATQECPPPCPSGALPADCPGPWPFGGLVSRRSCSGLCPHWADSGQTQG